MVWIPMLEYWSQGIWSYSQLAFSTILNLALMRAHNDSGSNQSGINGWENSINILYMFPSMLSSRSPSLPPSWLKKLPWGQGLSPLSHTNGFRCFSLPPSSTGVVWKGEGSPDTRELLRWVERGMLWNRAKRVLRSPQIWAGWSQWEWVSS